MIGMVLTLPVLLLPSEVAETEDENENTVLSELVMWSASRLVGVLCEFF